MCGRFSLGVDTDRLIEEFGAEVATLDTTPRFNIAPTQPVPAVVRGPDGLRAGTLRWGLVPRGSPVASRPPLINARAETVARRPSFARSFRRRRCWILADGFFEWTTEDGARVPYHISLPDGRPFAFAGLWDRLDGDGGPLLTCVILTTRPAPAVAPIHDRMPVILAPEVRDRWLDPHATPEALATLLEPWAGPLRVRRVSTRVNSVANDDPACVASTPTDAETSPH